MSIPKCSQNNQCINICINKLCHLPAFICNNSKCQCNYKKHTRCLFKRAQPLLEEIYNQGQDKTIEDQKSFKAILDIFQQMLQKLVTVQENFKNNFINFGITPNCLEFRKLAKQDQYNAITGALCYKIHEELENQQSGKLSLNNIQEINKFWNQKREIFNNFIENIKEITVPKRKLLSSLPSKIIFTSEQEKRFINFFDQPFKQLIKIFRASQNNFLASQFHDKCDGVENVVLLIETQFGCKIGAFISVPWKPKAEDEQGIDQQGKSFMFSISLNEKYQLISHTAIYNSSDYGPIIGGGNEADILISDQCHLSDQSFTNFPLCYNNGKYLKEEQASWTALTGQTHGKKFKVKQYQVFKVKWAQ